MRRPALTITAHNKPDPGVVADAAVALILDFHAKTSRPETANETPDASEDFKTDDEGADS